MDRKKRVEELKRKNRIAVLCRRWNDYGIKISIDSFLSQRETIAIQKDIINMLDILDVHHKSMIYSKTENVLNKYKKELFHYIDDDERYVFFLKKSTDYGAVVINGNTLKENMDFIIGESEYFNNTCCIFCCTESVVSGICMWLGEYDNRIYVW